ncbi:MAG: phosphate--AMP phosphotransferase [Tepidisphaerales bacterium]
MLENIDLSKKLDKTEYRKLKSEAELKLSALQRQAKELGIPVIIVFEGWDAAGKGTLINELILPLDPRGFKVHSTLAPTEEEALHPFLWRFWQHTPARGRITIFDRSWYGRVVGDRVNGEIKGKELQQAFEDIRSFGRQLDDDGNVIVKFFLHISKKEQKHRFNVLLKNPATAWRVSKSDLKHHKHYDEYLAAVEDMLTETDSDYAPWTVIEAHDHRFAAIKIFSTVIAALEKRIAARQQQEAAKSSKASAPLPQMPEVLKSSILDNVDLSLTLTRKEYEDRLGKAQDKLRVLEYEIFTRRIPVIIAYEGWDAGGKGGNIRRLTQHLDPRGYEVVPIAAPNDVEKSHHYLWRFWVQMPKAGHITIFDRTWYGRVLVERVEGFCTDAEWQRAYREINEMEQHCTNAGAVLLKFWMHIDPAEQLRRFKERQKLAYKQWKITEEDWRNRKKLPQYRVAVEEMLYRTSTPYAPWTVVESNCKLHARVKVLETVCKAIQKRLK